MRSVKEHEDEKALEPLNFGRIISIFGHGCGHIFLAVGILGETGEPTAYLETK